MSDQEIENYITLVSSLLGLRGKQRDEIGSELRDHMETRVNVLVEAGYPREKAVRMSLEEFGDAAGLAVQFVSVVQQSRRRWLMRFASFSIVGMFIVLVAAMAMWPKDARFGAPDNSVAQQDGGGEVGVSETQASTDSNAGKTKSQDETVYATERQASAKIEKALDSKIDIDLVEIEYKVVQEEIQDQLKIRVYMHSSALDAGMSPDELVTFRFTSISLRNALDLFLDEFDCSYVVKNGVLVIASRDDCPLAVKTFDCRELLELMPAVAEAPSGISGFGAGGVGGGGMGGGGGVFNVSPALIQQDKKPEQSTAENDEPGTQAPSSTAGTLQKPNSPSATGNMSMGDLALLGMMGGDVLSPQDLDRQQQIINLVQRMVTPDSWEDTSGRGSIAFVGNVLVVRQRGPELHRVGQLLDGLKASLKAAAESED